MPEEVTPKSASAPQEVEAWRELNLLLLRSAVDNAVHCGRPELEDFQARSREAMNALNGESSYSQVLIAAGGMAQSLIQYNTHTQKRVDSLNTEIEELLHLFARNLATLCDGPDCEEGLTRLREVIERPVDQNTRARVEECLGGLIQQIAKRFRAARELSDRLKDRVTILEQSAPLAAAGAPPNGNTANTDLCTGLPIRSEGEAAIRRAVSSEAQCYLAVFYLHRMALTNARFGEAIGNQVILFASQHVATTVTTRQSDLLYRWTGPSFVAVLERDESLLSVSSDVQRVISSPLSRFFETPTRSVYLPIKITGEVVPMMATSYAEVMDKIERFILQASGAAVTD